MVVVVVVVVVVDVPGTLDSNLLLSNEQRLARINRHFKGHHEAKQRDLKCDATN